MRDVGGAGCAVGGGAAMRASSPLRGAATPVTAESAANGARDWSRLGDVIHVLQPIAYLGALQVCGPDRPSMRRCAPWPRAIPWLVAVSADAAALALCSRARRDSSDAGVWWGAYALLRRARTRLEAAHQTPSRVCSSNDEYRRMPAYSASRGYDASSGSRRGRSSSASSSVFA